ncbi:glycosyltransferase [Halobium salinum]|nr:glycosyltransferase [Halobium salinum]
MEFKSGMSNKPEDALTAVLTSTPETERSETFPLQMKRFSVIVPVYNDGTGIRDTLESLLEVRYPRDRHEILVVDNGSTDDTKAVVESFAAEYAHVVALEETDIQSSYAARNTGVRRSTGELVAFVDSDMTVDASWLRDLDAVFQATDYSYVAGDVELYVPDGQDSVWSEYSLATGFPVRHYVSELHFSPTCCLTVRHSVFDDVGLFAEDLESGGDFEFGQRVFRAGYSQRFAGDVTYYHPARATFGQHLKKARRLGRGAEQRYRNHRDTLGGRPWYHLFNFLPPNPAQFVERVNSHQTPQKMATFYMIECVLKIASFVGRVEERTD